VDDDPIRPDPRGDYAGPAPEAPPSEGGEADLDTAGTGQFASGYHATGEEPASASASESPAEHRRDRQPPIPPTAEEG